MKQSTSLVGAIMPAVLALLAAGCDRGDGASNSRTEETPLRGGTAVLGSIADVDSWNEYLSRQTFAVNLLRRIYLRLAQEQGDVQEHPASYTPLLAESWERTDDGLTLTFRLRDALWSDGQPITASDVRFTWEAQTSPHVPWVGSPSKRHITNVEVVDERTARFHFDRSYPYQFEDAVEGGVVPVHVFGAVPFEQWPTHDWSTVSIASGPFVLEEHRAGEELVLRRNENYFDSRYPLLDRIVVRVVPDTSTLLTQLRAADIDYMENVPPDQAHALSRQPGISVIPFDYNVESIGWNGARQPFSNPVLRRALTQAIDRRALIEDLLFEYGRDSNGPLLSSWWSASHELEPWPYDPDAARATLGRLGYRAVDESGVASEKGRPLEFELLTNSGKRVRESMLVKIQEQLSRVGVKVTVRPVEMRTLGQQVVSGQFDGYLMGAVYSLRDLKSIFGSGFAPPDGANYVHYNSEEADALLAQLDEAEDWRAMRPVLDVLQWRIHEDQPYTFLYEGQRIVAHTARLHGVEIDVPADPLARLERYWVDAR
jgi:peptide/nickel transport system substrate-binding protein